MRIAGNSVSAIPKGRGGAGWGTKGIWNYRLVILANVDEGSSTDPDKAPRCDLCFSIIFEWPCGSDEHNGAVGKASTWTNCAGERDVARCLGGDQDYIPKLWDVICVLQSFLIDPLRVMTAMGQGEKPQHKLSAGERDAVRCFGGEQDNISKLHNIKAEEQKQKTKTNSGAL